MEGDRRLLAEDTDVQLDVYERSGGTTKLVSKGAANGPGFAWYADASRDGSHVIFDSSDQLAPDDTDFDEDIYDRYGGQAMLISPAPLVPCPDPSPLDGGLASEDGQRVLFPTDERLVPEDTDCQFDIYMRTAGATTLLSVGPTAGNGPAPVTGGVFSDDGTRVFFQTNEQLVAQDTDLVLDVYERSGTTTTLISAGGVNGNGAFELPSQRSMPVATMSSSSAASSSPRRTPTAPATSTSAMAG